AFKVHFHDFKRFSGGNGNGGTGAHGVFPSFCRFGASCAKDRAKATQETTPHAAKPAPAPPALAASLPFRRGLCRTARA
ncbi:hypothetical protein, partial [Neotabrizicola sp. sgz301269]|uniref:hypothetical protein n=1 Tax=Neotabrizicola sp. sgz301269 TaxID=3276282 RepID=UPI00376FBC3C